MYSTDEGVKALFAIPVGDMGVLVIDIKKRSVFGEREKEIVQYFAGVVADMLRHQDICSRESLYGRILDLMYEVENASLAFSDPRQYYSEVLDSARRYTGLAMGFICLLLPGGNQFIVEAVDGPSVSTLKGRSFPISQGLVGWMSLESFQTQTAEGPVLLDYPR